MPLVKPSAFVSVVTHEEGFNAPLCDQNRRWNTYQTPVTTIAAGLIIKGMIRFRDLIEVMQAIHSSWSICVVRNIGCRILQRRWTGENVTHAAKLIQRKIHVTSGNWALSSWVEVERWTLSLERGEKKRKNEGHVPLFGVVDRSGKWVFWHTVELQLELVSIHKG